MGVALLVYSCTSSISAFLTAPYTVWFPVVILAVLAVISVLSLMYALGPLIGSMRAIRPWVKVKIYELLLSIILILIFASIATELCTANPVSIYSSAGLISSHCTSSSGSYPVDNIYSLALCNLYQFNGDVAGFNDYIFFMLVRLSITPNLIIGNIYLTGTTESGHTGLLTSSGTQGGFISPGGPPSLSAWIDAGPLDISPLAKANKFEPFIIDAMYLFSLLNQLQLILIAASPYLFAFFMAIGLIARSFGVTRTFGGAMIAFGVGIGFLYPVLTSLNYGFLDYALEHTSQVGLAVPAASPILAYLSIAAGYVTNAFPLLQIPEIFFIYIGIIVIGVTFINILNFVILDAFIADFSQALGERMDFLSLLTNIV